LPVKNGQKLPVDINMKKKLLLNKHKNKDKEAEAADPDADGDRDPAKKRKMKKGRFMRLKKRKNMSAEELAKHLVIDEDGLIADGSEGAGGAEDFDPTFADEDEEGLTLLERAKRCMCRFPPEVDRAKALLEDALKAEPESLEILEYFGTMLSEEGDEDRAREVLRKSVTLKPDGGPERYLYLAQLSRGSEALGFYRRGAATLKAQLESSQNTPATSSSSTAAPVGTVETARSQSLRAQLAGAQASIAELYMTDLADDDDAEERCEEAVLEGLKADPDCLALLTAQTSLLKVQGRVEEAKEVSLKCFKLISAAIDAATEEGDLHDDDEEEDTGRPTLPDEDTIASLARDLIDLEQTNEARELMCGLLARDEEDFRAWILLGWCHVVEADPETAKECAEHGLKLCKKHKEEADMWKPELKKLLDKAASMKPGGSKAKEEGSTPDDKQ